MTEHGPNEVAPTNEQVQVALTENAAEAEIAVATFGAGCFWCVEAVFLELEGVVSVEAGYCNGSVENPTYRMVCSGLTGHAEVCQIRYKPDTTSFDELLAVFWKTHDPTTLNRQGPDSGTQYRSGVFFHNEQQRELAEKYKQELDESGVWNHPIVTEITPLANYYKAEDYHQNYYAQNRNDPYCQAVVKPKVDKFREVFKDKLKNLANSNK